MRLALILTLLVRLAPLPVGSSHCAVGEAMPASHGQQHEMPTGADHPADCPHCPPAECAAAAHCTVILPAVLAATVGFSQASTRAVPVSASIDPLSSRDDRPPVPPPVVAVT